MTLASKYHHLVSSELSSWFIMLLNTSCGPGTVLRVQHTLYLIQSSQPPKASTVIQFTHEDTALEKLKQLVQGPTNSKWRGEDLNPAF